MAGILKVDKYQDFNGNDIMTSDGSGNITLSSNMTTAVQAVGSANTPAFLAYLSSSQDINDSTNTKVQFDTELFDTDNTYDNSTNYRFTPGVAGKYVITIQMLNTTGTDYDNFRVNLKKNGSEIVQGRGANFNGDGICYSTIVTANTTDYFEAFFYHTKGSSTGVAGNTGNPQLSFFSGYKLIGV
jgi:hypothetical protein